MLTNIVLTKDTSQEMELTNECPKCGSGYIWILMPKYQGRVWACGKYPGHVLGIAFVRYFQGCRKDEEGNIVAYGNFYALTRGGIPITKRVKKEYYDFERSSLEGKDGKREETLQDYQGAQLKSRKGGWY